VPIAIDREESQVLIRVEGEFGVTSAAELRNVFIEAFASGKKVEIDLASAREIDVSFLQLLWVTERETTWRQLGRVSGVSDEANRVARAAGFEPFPGTGDAGGSRG
jgi:hypothetical protein